jgi:hypothetical protein
MSDKREKEIMEKLDKLKMEAAEEIDAGIRSNMANDKLQDKGDLLQSQMVRWADR